MTSVKLAFVMETELQLLSVELDKEYVRNKYCKFEIVRT
jgi:hypothetical protein